MEEPLGVIIIIVSKKLEEMDRIPSNIIKPETRTSVKVVNLDVLLNSPSMGAIPLIRDIRNTKESVKGHTSTPPLLWILHTTYTDFHVLINSHVMFSIFGLKT